MANASSPNSPKSHPWASGTLVGWLFVQAPMVGHDGTDCRCQSDSAWWPIPRAWGHPPEDGKRRGVGHFVGPDLSVRPQPLRAEVGECPRPPASGAPKSPHLPPLVAPPQTPPKRLVRQGEAEALLAHRAGVAHGPAGDVCVSRLQIAVQTKTAGQSAHRVRWTWRFFGASIGTAGDADRRSVSSEGRNYVERKQAKRRVRARALG